MPEFKLSVKIENNSSKVVIREVEDAVTALRKCYASSEINWRETMIMLCLNRRNAVIGFFKVSEGGMAGTVADPRMIMQIALLAGATAIILSHNHPSGSLQPSNADKTVTEKISQGAKYLDIILSDHIIITDTSYYSFEENNLL